MSDIESSKLPQDLKFQKYNRLTSQIIKSNVKKRILDIRKRNSGAVNELLNDLERSLLKKSNSHIPCGDINLNDLILRLLQTNRKDWENFILNLASSALPDTLSVFGTNLIYGGYLTETLNNTPRCSFVDLSDVKSPDLLLQLQKSLKNDLYEGRRVCIIVGCELLSENLLKIYHIFSETAFILIDRTPKRHAVQGIFNVLYIPESKGDSNFFSPLNSILNGIAQVEPCSDIYSRSISSFGRQNLSAGKGAVDKISGASHISYQNSISALFKFLSTPQFPIKSNINEFYNAICYIESFISNGNNCSPITIAI